MEKIPLELWDRLIRQDESATFFQTPQWHALASRYSGTETVVLRFAFGGTEAVLPLQRRKKALWTVHTSPFGTYTALVCGGTLAQAESDQVRARLASMNVDLASSPFTRNPLTVGRPTEAATRVLELDALAADALTRDWNRNHKRSLVSGLEAGITVRLAQAEADSDAYCRIYADQVRGWGERARGCYSDRLFQALWSGLGKGPAMKLWLAECDGSIVAGRICFYQGFHAVEWHAAALDAYRDKGANHVLIHAMVGDAKRSGFRIYDFNPNPGLPQVDHFKRGFGTKLLAFTASRNAAGLYAGISALRGR